jgi:hypothetical protein
MREHLMECDECVDHMLLFLEPHGPPGGKVVDFEAVVAWRAIQSRLRWDRWRLPAALAAGLLVVMVGVSTSLTIHSRWRVAELTSPRLNVPVQGLERSVTLRGGERTTTTAEEPPATVEVPAGVDSFTLVLPAEPGAEHEVEIRDRDGEILWTGRGLKGDDYGTATVWLSREFLPAGEYRIRIHGLDGGPTEPREDFQVTVRYLDEGSGHP